jgi:hypothetical protein
MIILATVTIYYTNLMKVLISDDRIYSSFLFICLAGYSFVFSCVFYISFYLPLIKKYKNDDEWEVDVQNHIKAIAFAGSISTLCFIIATWNVYGIYSFFIIVIVQLGFVFTYQFVPSGMIGNIIFF